jgi:lipopolysaccharide transport system ATP-binding protein
MSGSTVISVTGLTKAYRIWTTPAQRLVSPALATVARWFPGALGATLDRQARAGYGDFFALQEVSFEVNKGEAVGIIGRNGAGKSTLLQILSGTLQPTGGTAAITGRVAALLELGAGFNPEFTGRENVFLNGAILGLSAREMTDRFGAITAFADIGDFIDQPVKTYSSGMLVRLAFATQTAIEPEILIVDEALSVGDFFFQQKCFKRIAELRARGTTILFVSHDMASVRDLCSRVLYLRRGAAVFFGESQQAIARYYREDDPAGAAAPVPTEAVVPATHTSNRLAEALPHSLWRQDPAAVDDDDPAELLAVEVLNSGGQPALKHRLGDTAVIRAYFQARADSEVHVALELKNRHGQVVSSLGSRVQGMPPTRLRAGQTWCCETRMQLGLEAGLYSFQIGLGRPHAQPNLGVRFAETPWLGPLTIDWDYNAEPAPFLGMFNLPAKVSLQEVS